MLYNDVIMKTVKTSIRKLRNRLNPSEIYFTQSDWDPKEIDGVLFLPVAEQIPIPRGRMLKWMRKDSLEYVK